MSPKPSTSPLAAFGRFLVFGMIGTLTGLACAEASRGIWSTSPTPFAGLVPLLSYALLIFAVCRLRFGQSEAKAHGILLLYGTGILLALLPYAVLVAHYRSSGMAFPCVLALAAIS